MFKEDWAAAMSSEVFREYLGSELLKQAQPKTLPAEETNVLDEFDQFQSRVKSDPKLLLAFRALQTKFATDANYRSQVNPQFADAVMLLDLETSEE